MRIRLLMLLTLFSSAVIAQDNTGSKNQSGNGSVEEVKGYFKNLNNSNPNLDFTVDKEGLEIDGNETDQNDSKSGVEYLVSNEDGITMERDSNSVYGRAFLSNQLLGFTSESSLVPPPNYRIGPGDMIAINIWDGPQEQQIYTVDKDGSIFPQFLGKIYVQGLTFENLQSMLKSRYYTIVPSGSKIDVQLVKVRTIRINVVGEVKRPNAYTVSSFGTALNVLAMAGGVTELGSMRNIQIKRNGYTIYNLDLYEFIANGGQIDENIYLENNDYIVVPVHDKTVTAAGRFMRPMKYQLREDENLQALLKYTGGVTADARKTGAKVTRYGYETKKQIDIPLNIYLDDEYIDFILKDLDYVEISQYVGDVSNVVNIKGAVQYPDTYELIEGERLYDLIVKSGGLRSDAYLKRAIIQRGDSTNLSNTYNLNLENFDENSTQNIELKYGDEVTIFSNADFYTDKQVKILGEVRKPGQYAYTGQISVKDLILLAGGLTESAEYTHVEISRIYDSVGTMDYIRTKPNQIFELDIYPNLENDTASENFYLLPYDIVSIKRTINFELQDVVTIRGKVIYPGSFTLQEDSRRISDIIKRAGGLDKNAKLKSAVLKRRNLGEFYCDFPKAYKNPGSKWDLLLMDGDSLYIPDDRNFVTIRGAVLEPISTFVNPDFTTLKDYINLAGGFTDSADTKKLYVKYADGKSSKPRKFLFYTFYPAIEDGCVINIPSKDPSALTFSEALDKTWDRTSRTLQSITALTSTMASGVLMYLSLKNGL